MTAASTRARCGSDEDYQPSVLPTDSAEDPEIAEATKQGRVGADRVDWGLLYGEFNVGQSDFEKAFFIAVQELKKRAALLEADAVIGMRQDIDLDTNAFQFFYLQMYGTAVKYRR